MRTISITSGKGGVGKTNIAANLAIALAKHGRRVVVIDGDIGLANLDVILGVQPKYRLQSVVSGEVTLREALVDGPGGIRFLGGGSGAECLLKLTGRDADTFLTQLNDLASETDELIIDTGAGIDENVLTFLDASDTVAVVATQDPASIADAYAITKVCIKNRPEVDLRLIVNMADDEAAAKQVHKRFSAVTEQFLRKSIPLSGYIRNDSRAVTCIRNRKPYLVDAPSAIASCDVQKVARNLIGLPPIKNAGIVERLRYLFEQSERLAS